MIHNLAVEVSVLYEL